MSELIILAVYKAIKGSGHVSDYTTNKPWQIINISKVVPISCSDSQGRAPRLTALRRFGVLHLGTMSEDRKLHSQMKNAKYCIYEGLQEA